MPLNGGFGSLTAFRNFSAFFTALATQRWNPHPTASEPERLLKFGTMQGMLRTEKLCKEAARLFSDSKKVCPKQFMNHCPAT
jgi:hypothetical protein